MASACLVITYTSASQGCIDPCSVDICLSMKQILATISVAVCASQSALAQLSECDAVPGGPGNGRDSHIPSIACKCSGSAGCDSFNMKPYPSSKYAEMFVSDATGKRFEQQDTLKWARAVRPTKNSTVQQIQVGRYQAENSFDGFGTGLSDAAAINIKGMTPAAQSQVLNEYGKDYRGIRVKLCQNHREPKYPHCPFISTKRTEMRTISSALTSAVDICS